MKDRSDIVVRSGVIATLFWVAFFGWITSINLESLTTTDNQIDLNELGDYLAGVAAPLAFLWFLIAVYLQRKELQNTVAAYKAQTDELTLSRDVYKAQVKEMEEMVRIHKKEGAKRKLADLEALHGDSIASVLNQISRMREKFGPDPNSVQSFADRISFHYRGVHFDFPASQFSIPDGSDAEDDIQAMVKHLYMVSYAIVLDLNYEYGLQITKIVLSEVNLGPLCFNAIKAHEFYFGETDNILA